MSSYEYTDPAGDTITIRPTTLRGDVPAVDITVSDCCSTTVYVPLAMVEEVVAGLRDMARQAGGQAPLTAAELAAGQADVDALEAEFGPEPRRFYLLRRTDVSGVSGTGIVADGVLWPDGTASLRWKGDRPSTVHWDRMADAEAVHGHGGATEIVWIDQP